MTKKKSQKHSKKTFKGLTVLQQVKAARKESRLEEIRHHGKLLNRTKIEKSKKTYSRSRFKNDPEN